MKARQATPSVIVLDELDAFASARKTTRSTKLKASMTRDLAVG